MSTYRDDDLLSGLWDETSDRNKLLTILAGKDYKTKAKWAQLYDVIMPLYREGVTAGKYKLYIPWTSDAEKTEKAIADRLNVPQTTVHEFLLTLQVAAQQQQVTMVAWDPTLPGKMQSGLLERTGEAASEAARSAARASAEAIGELLKGLWPLILGATAVALIIYSPAIKRAGRAVKSTGTKVRSYFS
jgi:hypothetical protein